MGEGAKSVQTMVRAHAAGAESTESHLAGGQMNDRVVDAAAAKTTAVHDLSGSRFVPGEQIQCQWMRHTAKPADGFLQRVEGEHRQDRTENLLLHDSVPKAYAGENRRCDLQGLWIGIAACDDLLRVDQTCDSVEMLFVDDLPVIWIAKRIAAELTPDFFFDLFYKGVPDALVTVNVIRSHAGLAAV